MIIRPHDVLRKLARSLRRPAATARAATSTSIVTSSQKATYSSTAAPAKETTSTEKPKRKRTPKSSATGAGAESKPRRSRAKAKPVIASGDDAGGDIASRLQAAMPWRAAAMNGRSKKAPASVLDPNRVHVVGEKLCDDVINYMGKSLDRHVGCDLVDLNPGSGLWSRKLHERLQPRKHILMEGDAELYSPFLSDLIAKENVELIPKSGIVWKDLTQMLETRLDKQTLRQGDGPPERNDTLLVTANLATNPTRKIFGYDSISTMVLHQFITSIHFSSLFQRYGRVRLLIWTNDEEKRRVLPRALSRRKRLAFQTELACEWVHEVVGLDNGNLDSNYLRDDWINIESAYATLERMQAQNLVMPPGREPQHHLDALANPSLIGQRLAGTHPPLFKRPYLDELEELRAGADGEVDLAGADAKQTKIRARFLVTRQKIADRDAEIYLNLLQTRDKLYNKARSRRASTFANLSKSWLDQVSTLKKNASNEFALIRDNYHLFRQSPPVMLWDRRAFEPLVPQPSEFFPRSPCTLIDIQPKAMNPLFLQYGPSSTRSGDMSDIMLRAWFSHLSHPAPHAMHAVWAGFGDSLEACPSFFDSALGGSPIPGGQGAITARSINERQWSEVVQAWMDWPFRPDFTQFLGRTLDEPDADDDDAGASGSLET